MIKSEPGHGAKFRRIELSSRQGTKGEYRRPACDQVLEVFDGDRLVAYRRAVQPALHDKIERQAKPDVALLPIPAPLENAYSASDSPLVGHS